MPGYCHARGEPSYLTTHSILINSRSGLLDDAKRCNLIAGVGLKRLTQLLYMTTDKILINSRSGLETKPMNEGGRKGETKYG